MNIENPKESTKNDTKINKVINQDHMENVQQTKSVLFLYTFNGQLETEILKS